jgi:DNA-binding Xre family transcriptional regulator
MPASNYPPEGLVICNLQALMDERHLSGAEVSRITGLSRPTVRKLRTNQFGGLSMATVARLCSALQVGVGVLLTHKPQVQLASEGEALVGAHK